jgi:RHS repeat-associated protein/uncharacterized repeat protein (TIGR01451 family)
MQSYFARAISWALLGIMAMGSGCLMQDEPLPASSEAVTRAALSNIPATDESCGTPAAPSVTHLVYLGSTQFEYGDSLPLVARLTDEMGRPLAGRELSFKLDMLDATGVTDDLGIARVTLTPTGTPASLPLTVTYAGDELTAPASASATVVITRADTVTRFEGPALLATGVAQQVRARLLDADELVPITGRLLVFEADGVQITATTDASGVATASLSWNTTGSVAIRAAFEGDAFYEPSSDETTTTWYLPTAFTIWGGNTPAPQIGQRFNFWGHSWASQVQGGDYDAQAEFKGFAAGLDAFALCQPAARTTGTPLFTPGCWGSKGGQSFPPDQLPEYIGVLVPTAITKQKGKVYGNISALGVLRVDPEPAYGPVPGKPGWGTLVAVIDGGTVLSAPAALVVSQRQPSKVFPGQSFEVLADISNPSPTRAEDVIVSEHFDGSLPASAEQQVGTLEPGTQQTIVFQQTAMPVAPRGPDESESAYMARLAEVDGRAITSIGQVRFVDPRGTNPPALDVISASLLQVPRLAVSLSTPSCAGPCTTLTYTLTITHIGSARATDVIAMITLPDGSQQAIPLGELEPLGTVTRTAEWIAPNPGPKRPDETVEAYLARLQAFGNEPFTASASVTWNDAQGNGYGPIGRESSVTPGMSLPVPIPESLAPVLPGQMFPLPLAVINLGNLLANQVRLHLTGGGSTELFDLAPGQSTVVTLDAAAPSLAPKGEAETDAAYQARLAALNGQTLVYEYQLDWATPCGDPLGPLPGHMAVQQILPVLALTLEGPNEAQAGDTLTYTLTLQNTGSAEATGLDLTLTPPGGSRQIVSIPGGRLAPGARLQMPVHATLPLLGVPTMGIAVASVRWSDAAGNAYGPLSALASTDVMPSNLPPVVDAGPDQSIVLPASAMLAGRITDDGQPEGAELVVSWVQVGGPGLAWFADAGLAETSATFSEPGTYVLRLIGNDSQLTAYDELTVVVAPRAGQGTTLPGGTPAQNETLINVVRDGNQLRLDGTVKTFKFIWVPISSKGTTVKLDTDTGAVLAEYYTSPNGQPRDPSRTGVDKNGSVWVTNRAGNSAVHIGLLENGQCVDRNGNGVIDTSQGLGDVRPWTNAGGADTQGGVSTATDECIVHYVRVSSAGTRHVSVDANNDVWVSGVDGIGRQRFNLIDGRTGTIKRTEPSVGYGGYNGLIDSQGVIWSTKPLLRWNAALPLTGPNGGNWRGYPGTTYSLCMAPDGHIWVTTSLNDIRKYSPSGQLVATYSNSNFRAESCVVDRNGHVWFTRTFAHDTVGHLKPDGSFVGNVRVGSGPTGLSVDSAGKIWTTNYNSRTASRIDPTKGPLGPDGVTRLGEVDFTSVDLGGNLYTSSDMTGNGTVGAPDYGTWTIVYDSASTASQWGRIAWTGRACGDGAVTVTAASSPNSASFGPLVPVRSGEDFNVPNGRYLKVNVAFQRSSKGESPAIYDLTLGTADYVPPPQINTPPEVSAGPSRIATYPNPVKLVGSACDDTLPAGGALALQWTRVSGPGTVTFSAPNKETTDTTFSEPGEYVLRLTASDSTFEEHGDVTVTVLASNFPPEVAVDSPYSVPFPPGSVVLTGMVEDDGLPEDSSVSVAWSKVSGPGNVSFANADSVPTTATFSQPGTYVVRLTASDGQLSRSEDVLIVVGGTASANQPPVVSAGPSWRITLPERAVTLRGSVTDDGKPTGAALNITWSQVSGPQGVVFANAKQAETAATFNAVGSYLLRLRVSDSVLTGSADVLVTVESAPVVNAPPLVSAGPNRTIALPPGWTTLSGTATDDGRPEGSVLHVGWSQANGPGAVTFATPDQLETQASFPVPGSYTLLLTASDSERTSSAAVRIEASQDLVNAPPMVSAEGPSLVSRSESTQLSGSVYDEGLPATGTLTVAWSQVSGPGIATFSAPDRVASRVTFSADGEYVLRLTASDSELSASDEIAIQVESINQPPVVSAGADLMSEQRTAMLYGSVNDDGLPDGSIPTARWSVVGGPGLVAFDDPSSPITEVTFSKPGEYVLHLTASDSELSASDEVIVRVLAVDMVFATPGWLGEPAHGSTVSGLVPIKLAPGITLEVGTVDYWPANDYGAATVLATNVSGTGGSTLATLDTTVLANGSYIIHLEGIDSTGTLLDSAIQVTVVGEYKPGRVRFDVIDLTVPVNGLPITIGRTYDSLERGRSGDFGFGWSQTVGSPRLEVDGGHNVTVTQPDGRRVTFYFTPVSSSWIFPYFFYPRYTAESGVYGSLTANGCSILVFQNGRYYCFLSAPDYSPTIYTYTDPHGTVFTMSADGSLQQIRDLNGATLTFGPDGITSSSGDLSVDIDRDAQGRITTVTDPEGNPYHYAYDAAGNLEQVVLPDVDSPLRYTYDASHLLLTAVDARSNQAARATYYPDGRLESETDALGNTMRYAYDVSAGTTTITNPDGGRSTSRRNTAGLLLSQTDPLGRTTSYTYDANRNRLTETNARGETKRFGYNSKGHVTSVSDPLGNTSSFVHNAYGSPTRMTDPMGNVIDISQNSQFLPSEMRDGLGMLGSFTWNSRSNLVTRVDAEGRATHFTYDDYGNELTETEPLGNTTSYTYDLLGRRLTETDPLGRVTRYSYDALGQIIEEIDPLGRSTRYEFDANGNEIAAIDPAGRRTTSTYDAADRLIEKTYPDGTSERYTYDFRGNELTEIDRAGRITEYAYDLAGQLIRVTTATGTADESTTTYTYDNAGRKIRETNALGQTTTYTYDAAGRLVTQTDALGHVTRHAYDATGHRSSVTDALGRVTRYSYDARGRPIGTIYPDGSTEQQQYNGAAEMVVSIDQAGRITRKQYDGTGRLLAVIDPLGHTTSYTYDAVGNMLSITDANGHTTRFAYDAVNRLVSKIWPDGSSEVFEYDDADNQIGHWLADGQLNQFSYDAMDRMLLAEYFDGQIIEYTYTSSGQRETASDARGTTRYVYDEQDRLVRVIHPDGQEIGYRYDALGNRRELITPVGTVAYAYDALNRLVAVTDPRGRTTAYGYNEIGLRMQRRLPNGITTTYGYDTLSRLTSIEHRRGQQPPLASYNYTLDLVGNRLSVVEGNGTSIEWRYDQADRLLEETLYVPDGSVTRRRFTYDATGNRLAMTLNGEETSYGYDELDQLLIAGGAQYSYDGRGNLFEVLESRTSTSFDYGAEDRLGAVTRPDGTRIDYAYDADGRRIEQTVGANSTAYLWDETSVYGDVVLETDTSGTPLATYLLGDDELIAQERDGSVSYYLHDGQGSVRALADASGTVTDHYRYDSYGDAEHIGSTVNPYQYTGQQFDALTGLYSLRARYYDPNTGRFLSRDRAAIVIHDPVELNRYAYARSNPIRYSDPSGYEAFGGVLLRRISISSAPAIALTGRAVQCLFVRTASGVMIAARNWRALQALSQACPGCVITILPSQPSEQSPINIENPDSLRGASPEEVEAAIPPGWRKEPSNGEGGTRYANPDRKGEQVRVMPGKPTDRNPVKRGPYARVSRNGVKSEPIPLKGNPTLLP